MSASTMLRGHIGSRGAAAVALLLIGVVATPAQADSFSDKQWHLSAMKADQMWQTSTGKGVTVAVIDTGVDDKQQDLRGRVLPGLDEAPKSAGDEHTDYDGHGTGMAILIAGAKGSGGLAPAAKILPIRLADRGLDSGRYTKEFNETVSAGIRHAVDSGARVINISMRAFEGSKQLTSAVKYALDKGALVFAGVGNNGDSDLEYPAATPGVVAVGAIGKNLRKTKESQYGPQVDVAAPGEEIYSTCNTGAGLCKSHGTSDATALASASAALIWSKHPNWTNNQVLRVMLNTIGAPTDGSKRNDSIGYGVVRPRVALENPGDPGPADEYPLPDLKQASTASPTPSTPKPGSGSGTGEENQPKNRPAASASSSSDDSSNTTLMVSLGVGAVAVIGGALIAMALRKRRHTASS
ncbi:type VII secretion-associated serine protease mycosin [Actinomycetota bacterium Odt1-20B]